MATFTMDTKALWNLKNKIASKAKEFEEGVFNATKNAFETMTNNAKRDASPSKLPHLPGSKGKYKRTGNLSRSIGFTYGQDKNGAYFRFFADAHYAPYVEFGTGGGYGVPSYRTPELSKGMNAYSSLFKGSGGRNFNMPYRPYFFSNADKEIQRMIKIAKSLSKK